MCSDKLQEIHHHRVAKSLACFPCHPLNSNRWEFFRHDLLNDFIPTAFQMLQCGQRLLDFCFDFGLFCAALGIAALATRRRGGRSPYDPAARNLLRKQQFGHGSTPVQAVFSPSGLSLHFDQGPEPIQKLSYDCFECVIESQDLLLPVRDGRVIVLQKKDLPAGALPELREQVLYMTVVPSAAHR